MVAWFKKASGLSHQELLVAAVVVLGAIMSILDVTIVNVAIDSISRDLHAPLSQVQWIATGYMLALVAVIPLSSWAAERFGARRVMLVSIASFMFGSLICGFATSIEELIIFRVIQGLGAGMLMPVGMSILAITAGKDNIGKVMGIVGVPMLLGPVLGPIIGGILVQYLSWEWIFFVNIPIGIGAFWLGYRVLAHGEEDKTSKLDWLGVVLLSPGLALLLYGLAEAGEAASIHGVKIIGSIVVGLTMITAFVFHSLRATKPLLNLRLMKNRVLRSASATMTLLGLSLFGSMLLIPLYFQLVHGADALQAGLLMAPQGLAAAIMMPLSSKLADSGKSGISIIIGITLLVIGTLVWTQVGADTSNILLGVSLFIRGAGMGMAFTPIFSAAYISLSPKHIPEATSMMNVLQRVGGAFGTALFSIYLTQNFTDKLQSKGIPATGTHSLPSHVPPVLQQLFASSFAATFWIVTIFSIITFIPALFLWRNIRAEAGHVEPASEVEPTH